MTNFETTAAVFTRFEAVAGVAAGNSWVGRMRPRSREIVE
jgi:hypothetical protein